MALFLSMKMALPLIFLLVVTWQPSEESVSFIRILRLIGKSTDVGGFAELLLKFFKNDNTQITNENLIRTIGTQTEATNTAILSELLQTPKLDRIYDAAVGIDSAMKDLKNIVQEGDGQNYETYKRRFVLNFGSAAVMSHIRFLPQLLTYTIPGFGEPLLAQLHKTTRCNATAIGIFREFYVNLLSNGIGLQAVYEEFTTQTSLVDLIRKEWADGLEKVQANFDQLEMTCFDELSRRANQAPARPCPAASSAALTLTSTITCWLVLGLISLTFQIL